MANGQNNSAADAATKAAAKFQQVARRKTEADQAIKDQIHARESETTKTARLKALRLAKEEVDREAAAVAAAEKAAAAPAKKRAARKKAV